MHRFIAQRSVSAIIPAAGANTRLEGKVAPFLKPALLIDGQPLINHAIHYAWKCQISDIFIVVSPYNANVLPELANAAAIQHKNTDLQRHIIEYEGHSALNYILQPKPDGIIDALQRCIRFITNEWTLILCADNIFQEDRRSAYEKAVRLSSARHDDSPYFASRSLNKDQAKRFTTHLASSKHQPFRAAYDNEGTEKCWIGPLLLPTELLREAMQAEQTIVDVLNTIHLTRRIEPFPMRCSDMGIPEEL